MKINEPKDLNIYFGGTRITSYNQLKYEIVPLIQMLKNSSGLEFLELYRGQGSDIYNLECGLSRYSKDAETMKEMDLELQQRFFQEIYKGNLAKICEPILPRI